MDWLDVEGVGRVALNAFSPGELETATGLTTDLQRVWRRRGQLPARDGGTASFDAREVAAIAVRLDLARFGITPSDTVAIGEEAARFVLYSALLSCPGAAEIRGGFDKIASVAARFAADDRIAARITGADGGRRYIWGASPSDLHFEGDIATLIAAESHSAILVLDLTVKGIQLAQRASRPLFLIDATNV